MSSGSDSDDDYVPGEPEKVSEEDSADEETDLQYQKELEHKTKKRKVVQDVEGKKKIKTRNSSHNHVESDEKETVPDKVENPEEEKKRVDDLWAKFLEGTDTKNKATTSSTSIQSTVGAANNSNKEIVKNDAKKTDNDKEREKRIFEFAGETIVVENNVIKEKIKTTETATASKEPVPSLRARGSGLSNVLGQLNKMNKLSTLEKSKLDWDTYKQEEGIEEEVQSYKKGKTGYLDRRDFLDRSDLRQYEIERDMRINRRSNR